MQTSRDPSERLCVFFTRRSQSPLTHIGWLCSRYHHTVAGRLSTPQMPALRYSSIRPTSAQLANLAKLYASNRPAIQRVLTAGFVIFILSSSYNSISGRPPHQSHRQPSKQKSKQGSPTKHQRVAVRISLFISNSDAFTYFFESRSMPSSTIAYPPY